MGTRAVIKCQFLSAAFPQRALQGLEGKARQLRFSSVIEMEWIGGRQGSADTQAVCHSKEHLRNCPAELILVWPLQFSLKLKTGLFPAPPTCKVSSVLKALLISVLTYPRWDDNLWVLLYTFHPEFLVTDCSNITFMIPFLCSPLWIKSFPTWERGRGFCFLVQPPTDAASFSHFFYGLGRQLVYTLWMICLPY